MREITNPFNGETIVIPRVLELTSSEREAVKSLLAEVGASAPDPDTYCSVTLPDGGEVGVAVGNLCAEGPCGAFALEYNALTRGVASFIHTLASRGNLAIMSSSGTTGVAVPSADQKEKVRSRWPEAEIVDSPSDLERWLRQNIR
jgi:hypothetical protein